jgi:hypothetical protein
VSDKETSSTDFDKALLQQATERWQKAAKIIGQVMMSVGEDDWPGDTYLAERLQALVTAGKLESQGDLSRIRFSEVRLPQKERTGGQRSQ